MGRKKKEKASRKIKNMLGIIEGYAMRWGKVEQRKMREMLAIMNAHMNDNTNPPARSNCVSSFSDLLPLFDFDIVADAVDECD